MIRPAIPLFVILAALAPPSEAVASGGEPVQKPAPAAAAPAPAPAEEEEAQPAPPGSPADVALWRSGVAVGNAITVERARAGALQARVKANQYLERLEAAAAKASPKEKEALLALRTRLLEAWQLDYQLMVRQWPVDPTRGCGYAILSFESLLRAQDAGDRGALGQARGQLTECVAKAESAVRPLVEATRVLEAAATEAERALRPPAKEPAEKDPK
jgi:hypothetical protein